MQCIEIPKEINNFFSLFYYLGLWHRGDKPTVRETRIKLFYSMFHLLFLISLMVGAIKSENREDLILLSEAAIGVAVISMTLLYLIWKKNEILDIVTLTGVYSIDDRDQFTVVNDKLKKFMKFLNILMCMFIVGAYSAVVVPMFRSDNELFFKIGFPLDWKNNDVAFWIATVFLFFEVNLSIIAILFSLIIWYVMLNCALRYEILQSQIRNMGVIVKAEAPTKKRKISDKEKQKSFLLDLKVSVDSHQHLRELIRQVESFCSNLFFAHIVTSSLSICCSIYCLAFNVGGNFMEQFIHLLTMVYHISEIFMIMHFGNEIKFSSDRLMYCLFESNWIDQPEATKKLIIIFGELLKQPHELVVGKLYPLTLETFRRILNCAYNTFNILKNLKV